MRFGTTKQFVGTAIVTSGLAFGFAGLSGCNDGYEAPDPATEPPAQQPPQQQPGQQPPPQPGAETPQDPPTIPGTP